MLSRYIKDEIKFDKIDIDEFLKLFVKKISELNKIEFKSLLLYYYHDLENRISTQNKEGFINYKHKHIDFKKENLFNSLRFITMKYKSILLDEIKSNKDAFEFIKFLFYIDNVYFLDFLTFFIIANYDIITIDNPTLKKEINMFRNCVGL